MPEGESAMEEDPQIFLSFSNHLGSTSAVTDFADGTLVEWKTNYAYGADESEWKNGDEKYDNADEPYGFTGKEEDQEVGLHYFGARYYSSYLGRWLSPDPPVVHGGGLSNHYNYGANSPYIYVDPDGNWANIIIGMIAGAVTGAITASNAGADEAGEVVAGAIVGAWVGGLTAMIGSSTSAAALGAGASQAAASMAGAAAASGAAATASMVQTATLGGSAGSVMLSGAVSSVSGLISGAIGVGASNSIGGAIINYVASVGISYGTTAISGGLNEDTWDDVLLSSSISYWTSYAGSAVGAELSAVEGGGGGGDETDLLRYHMDGGPSSVDGGVSTEENSWTLDEVKGYLEKGGGGSALKILKEAGFKIFRFDRIEQTTTFESGEVVTTDMTGKIKGATVTNSSTGKKEIYIWNNRSAEEAAATLVHEAAHVALGPTKGSAEYLLQEIQVRVVEEKFRIRAGIDREGRDAIKDQAFRMKSPSGKIVPNEASIQETVLASKFYQRQSKASVQNSTKNNWIGSEEIDY